MSELLQNCIAAVYSLSKLSSATESGRYRDRSMSEFSSATASGRYRGHSMSEFSSATESMRYRGHCVRRSGTEDCNPGAPSSPG